jgi:hypothetical protein
MNHSTTHFYTEYHDGRAYRMETMWAAERSGSSEALLVGDQGGLGRGTHSSSDAIIAYSESLKYTRRRI